MTWAAVKARVVVTLATVNITAPITQTIKRVYPNPPGTIQDFPCFIIYPPAVEVERRPSGWRKNTYIVRLRCVVSDQDMDQAAALVDAYREATITAFDADTTLEGNATVILAQAFLEAGSVSIGGRDWTGLDCMLTIRDDSDVTYGI